MDQNPLNDENSNGLNNQQTPPVLPQDQAQQAPVGQNLGLPPQQDDNVPLSGAQAMPANNSIPSTPTASTSQQQVTQPVIDVSNGHSVTNYPNSNTTSSESMNNGLPGLDQQADTPPQPTIPNPEMTSQPQVPNAPESGPIGLPNTQNTPQPTVSQNVQPSATGSKASGKSFGLIVGGLLVVLAILVVVLIIL